MSTELIETLGTQREESLPLSLTSFYGGVDNGKMLQVTIGDKYAALNHNDTLKLIIELLKWLEDYSKNQIEEYKKMEGDLAKVLKGVHEKWVELNEQNQLLYEMWK